MLITETKELLRQIALVDNRKVSNETIEAWHGVIGAIPFDIAKEALKLAQQDSSIKYLEPRNIIGWAKEAAFRLDRNNPKQEEPVKRFPMPKCRAHGTGILSCDPCGDRIYRFTQENGFDRVHEWAKAEIYG